MAGVDIVTASVECGHPHRKPAMSGRPPHELKAGQRAEVPAHACTPATPRDNSALAQIKRELFTAADQLQQPADLVVQLLVLAELRGMRAEQASDRFAHGAAVLS